VRFMADLSRELGVDRRWLLRRLRADQVQTTTAPAITLGGVQTVIIVPTEWAEKLRERYQTARGREQMSYVRGQEVVVRLSSVGGFHHMIDAVVVSHIGSQVVIQDIGGQQATVSEDNVWANQEAAEAALKIFVSVDARGEEAGGAK
jgi:hypothetical protein